MDATGFFCYNEGSESRKEGVYSVHHSEVHTAVLPMPLTRYALLLVLLGIILGVVLGLVFRFAIVRLAQSRRSRDGQASPGVEDGRQPLSDILKAQRTAHDMTQEQVAEALGVSRQAVSKWESGAAEPSTSNLLALAKLYGVDLNELLRDIQT